jgi:capsule biosynthesis phosphatase
MEKGAFMLRIVLDVDGVICDDRDSSIPYADRQPYPEAVEMVRELHKAGHRIIWQTARYMNKFDGDQQRASEYGGQELRWWLKEHNIPADEVYLGKASGHIYCDDRGCQIRSNFGKLDWAKFQDIIKKTSN